MANIITCLFPEKNPFYSTVAPLRLLFLKRDDPELWTRVNSLMDNNKAGRGMILTSGPGSLMDNNKAGRGMILTSGPGSTHSWTTTRQVEG